MVTGRLTLVKVTLDSGVSAKLDALPAEVTKLAFVSAFLDDRQMRRLFAGSQSAKVCDELGLPFSKNEAENCRTIAGYWAGLE